MPASQHLRELLLHVLPTDADLMAFVMDHHRAVAQRFTDGQERVQRTNLLLWHVAGQTVLIQLRAAYPVQVAAFESAHGPVVAADLVERLRFARPGQWLPTQAVTFLLGAAVVAGLWLGLNAARPGPVTPGAPLKPPPQQLAQQSPESPPKQSPRQSPESSPMENFAPLFLQPSAPLPVQPSGPPPMQPSMKLPVQPSMPPPKTAVEQSSAVPRLGRTTNSSRAQQPLSGDIRDCHGQPARDLRIVILGKKVETKTDNDGQFTLTVPGLLDEEVRLRIQISATESHDHWVSLGRQNLTLLTQACGP